MESRSGIQTARDLGLPKCEVKNYPPSGEYRWRWSENYVGVVQCWNREAWVDTKLIAAGRLPYRRTVVAILEGIYVQRVARAAGKTWMDQYGHRRSIRR